MKRLFCLGTVAAVLCLYQKGALGQGASEQSPIELEKITLQEIVPEGVNVQLLPGGTPETTLPTPSFKTQLQRQLSKPWQITIPADICNKKLSVSSYELIADNNTSNNLSNSTQSNSEIKVLNVQIEPKTPTCISIDESTNTAVVQLQAIFHLDLFDVKTSGSYSGKLSVNIVAE